MTMPDWFTPAPAPGGMTSLPTVPNVPMTAAPTPTPSTPLWNSSGTSRIGGLLESGQVGPASLLGFAKAQEVQAAQPNTGGGAMSFDDWLTATGLTSAWQTGSAAVQKDIWTAYQASLTGVAPTEEGATGGTTEAAAPLFSPEEERLLTDLDNAIKVGQLDEDQAWKVIEGYWNKERETTYRAQEATTRGTELLSGAFPGTTLPMTGAGGMGESLQKQYGLPNLTPAVQGLPMSQASGVYGQAQQGLGLPAQLSPLQQPNIQLPNWGNFMAKMPTFGGGSKYLDALLAEGRSTAPSLG